MECRHDGCTCQVGQGEEFCSDYCRQHAGDMAHTGHGCECGHPGCAGHH